MLIYEDGDLVANNKYTVFCQQCNCFGAMRSGIAKQIGETYPIVIEKDKQYFKSKHPLNIFGTILPVRLPDGRTCINLYSQYYYGHEKQQTNYDMFERCMERLYIWTDVLPSDTIVAFPYKIGCGLGGGDWSIVEKLISDFSDRLERDIYIVRKYAD